MKVFRFFVFPLFVAAISPAQEPSMAGTWQLAQQTFEYRKESGVVIPQDISSDISPVIFTAGGGFSAGTETGTWFFSNDFLLAVQPGQINTLAVNETGDTFVFASLEEVDLGGGAVERKSRLNIAVKEPTTGFGVLDVGGDWVFLQQELEFRDSPAGGGTVRTLRGVSQSRTDLNLRFNETFRAEVISDTGDPENVGDIIDGTWEMNAGELQATVGSDVITRTHFSSGGDLLVFTEEENASDGDDTLYSSKLDLWIRKPVTLTTEDVVGCWAIAGTTIDLEVGAGGERTLEEIGFEESVLDFRVDGTGTIRVVDNQEPLRIGMTEEFTWERAGTELQVTTMEGTFRFVVSAEKDFAMMQSFEEDLAADTESFDFFGLVKLPDAPGFGGAPVSIELLDEEGAMKPVLTTATVTGVRYQVETGNDLKGWQGFGPIMTGTGGTISSDLPALTGNENFFRWRILPPPN